MTANKKREWIKEWFAIQSICMLVVCSLAFAWATGVNALMPSRKDGALWVCVFFSFRFVSTFPAQKREEKRDRGNNQSVKAK
ncbi:hypothetical protein J3F84DRAFT_339781 [Trichoderma pleuroticola]